MKNLIEQWIENWFAQKSSEIKLDMNDNFFEKGAIDSFGIMELIIELESQYEITFTQEEFQDHRFSNIQGLSEIIHGKIGN